MRFLWPEMLWLLALLPVLAGGYLMVLGRKRGDAARYPGLVPAEARGGAATLLRHVPAALLLLTIGMLLAAAARPSITIALPAMRETVILAIDVSHSMLAEDVAPNRLAAAQAAAKVFIAGQPDTTRIGLVAFSGEARLLAAPTLDRELLGRAIDTLYTQDATAIGAAILASLQALFPDADLRNGPDAGATPIKPGAKANGAIVLLTDGYNNAGPDGVEVARVAASWGVRVYTVGFGTPHGRLAFADGGWIPVVIDEAALRRIARTTGAAYMRAETAIDLARVYDQVAKALVVERQPVEMTAVLCAAAAAAGLLAAGLSLLWFNRLV